MISVIFYVIFIFITFYSMRLAIKLTATTSYAPFFRWNNFGYIATIIASITPILNWIVGIFSILICAMELHDNSSHINKEKLPRAVKWLLKERK